jgi:hypothetical protein
LQQLDLQIHGLENSGLSAYRSFESLLESALLD